MLLPYAGKGQAQVVERQQVVAPSSYRRSEGLECLSLFPILFDTTYVDPFFVCFFILSHSSSFGVLCLLILRHLWCPRKVGPFFFSFFPIFSCGLDRWMHHGLKHTVWAVNGNWKGLRIDCQPTLKWLSSRSWLGRWIYIMLDRYRTHYYYP